MGEGDGRGGDRLRSGNWGKGGTPVTKRREDNARGKRRGEGSGAGALPLRLGEWEDGRAGSI